MQRRQRPRRAGGTTELAKPAEHTEHTEPDFIAETYLAGHGQPISVAAAEGLLGGDGWPSGMGQDVATKGNLAVSAAAVGTDERRSLS